MLLKHLILFPVLLLTKSPMIFEAIRFQASLCTVEILSCPCSELLLLRVGGVFIKAKEFF